MTSVTKFYCDSKNCKNELESPIDKNIRIAICDYPADQQNPTTIELKTQSKFVHICNACIVKQIAENLNVNIAVVE